MFLLVRSMACTLLFVVKEWGQVLLTMAGRLVNVPFNVVRRGVHCVSLVILSFLRRQVRRSLVQDRIRFNVTFRRFNVGD